MTEKQLGERWAKTVRAGGSAVFKIHAAGLTGIPDWIVFDVKRVQLWEAKLASAGPRPYSPKMLRPAQLWMQRILSKMVESGGVVLLGDDRYMMLSGGRQLRNVTAREFAESSKEYR